MVRVVVRWVKERCAAGAEGRVNNDFMEANEAPNETPVNNPSDPTPMNFVAATTGRHMLGIMVAAVYAGNDMRF